ncbi:MAG TPA: hypothetical protein VGL70_01980 [Candidatus Binatia bacterium]|jgi:hypothetical protein
MNRLFYRLRAAILREALEIRGFMRLLTKRRNTGERWTKEERAEIKAHLKSLSQTVPVLLVFSLPGGSLLIPLLALALDRRKKRRAGPMVEEKMLHEVGEA